MWGPGPSVGPWRSISIKAFCQIFMKFVVEVVYQHMSRNRGARENRLGHSYTWFKDVTQFVTVISTFLERFG